jgi:hypothetical protein
MPESLINRGRADTGAVRAWKGPYLSATRRRVPVGISKRSDGRGPLGSDFGYSL